MRLIDTHCHLNDQHDFPDPAAAVQEAAEAGVDRLIVIGVDTVTSESAVELADRFEGVYAAAGWHPNNATEYQTRELQRIEELLAHPKCVALGEIGLDFYRDHSMPGEQYKCLLEQLELAESTGKPVVFHCREANPDLLDVLEKREPHPWLFHCFSGNADNAQRAVELGCMFGVDGPITYPKSDDLRMVFQRLPQDRILIETDAPWMAPAPYRGKRNRPAWITHINERLAEVLELTPEQCAALTTANAERFFGLA